MTDYPALPIPDRAKAAAGPISDPEDYAARHAVTPAEIEGDDDAQAIADRAAENARATQIGQARAALGRRPLDVRPFIDPVGARMAEASALLDKFDGLPYQYGGDGEHVDEGPNNDLPVTGGAARPNRAARRGSRRSKVRKAGQARKPKWCPAHETYHLVPVSE